MSTVYLIPSAENVDTFCYELERAFDLPGLCVSGIGDALSYGFASGTVRMHCDRGEPFTVRLLNSAILHDSVKKQLREAMEWNRTMDKMRLITIVWA